MAYSDHWFDTFLYTRTKEETKREIQFLIDLLPLSTHKKILDVCCGAGRHSIGLAEQGYNVVGIDINTAVLSTARQLAGDLEVNASFFYHDMKKLRDLENTFDAVIVMWQSFGQFSDQVNTEIIESIFNILNPNGKLILDIYNHAFFTINQGEREYSFGEATIVERKTMREDRLEVILAYSNSSDSDQFQWQVFSPASIQNLGTKIGFGSVTICADFDLNEKASEFHPRMQVIMER
ncbi:MAG: class I SAM-dependent methyltransferase [Candidatus Kariarchaeaceae archaeon]|jgi:SAM-dependent methyltransferase